jgi:DNA polymerase-1
MQAEIVGLSLCGTRGKARYLPVGRREPGRLDADHVLGKIAPLMENERILKHGHDLKMAMIVLARRGIALRGLGCDTMVASYVLNPSKRSHDLSEIARDHLNMELATLTDLTGNGAKKVSLSTFAPVKVMSLSCPRADTILKLASVLIEKIRAGGLYDLYSRIEMPLIEVLAGMEQRGVLIDTQLLAEMSRQFEQLLSLSEEKIYGLAGERFNINSPKQLQYILFEKLGLARGRKTKNGYSTDVDVLTALAKNYELPAEILAYRSIAKLKSTYIDALPAMINPETGRIHTSYNQTVTATGRLSSSDPNLQNIPIRGVEGKRIRQAFVAPEGSEIVSADYSQIELRILAHIADDAALIEFFRSGEDIHTRTAADMFGVFPGIVTPDMRRQAKVINFGIIYGMSPFGLAKELGISQNQAKAFIDRYFEEFKGVKNYIEGIVEQARRDGYVSTLFNRRRYLPEIRSGNFAVRQFAERTAINTPIQGTAADLIKAAMISISGKLKDKKPATGMIMQVHDELVFEVPLSEKKQTIALIKHEMESVIALSVPLVVEIHGGKNWEEAH